MDFLNAFSFLFVFLFSLGSFYIKFKLLDKYERGITKGEAAIIFIVIAMRSLIFGLIYVIYCPWKNPFLFIGGAAGVGCFNEFFFSYFLRQKTRSNAFQNKMKNIIMDWDLLRWLMKEHAKRTRNAYFDINLNLTKRKRTNKLFAEYCKDICEKNKNDAPFIVRTRHFSKKLQLLGEHFGFKNLEKRLEDPQVDMLIPQWDGIDLREYNDKNGIKARKKQSLDGRPRYYDEAS